LEAEEDVAYRAYLAADFDEFIGTATPRPSNIPEPQDTTQLLNTLKPAEVEVVEQRADILPLTQGEPSALAASLPIIHQSIHATEPPLIFTDTQNRERRPDPRTAGRPDSIHPPQIDFTGPSTSPSIIRRGSIVVGPPATFEEYQRREREAAARYLAARKG
jgi:hypothetical protein